MQLINQWDAINAIRAMDENCTRKDIMDMLRGMESYGEYDYKKVLEQDIKEYIKDEMDLDDYKDDNNEFDMDKFRNDLYDRCFSADSVTGNGSGSYTFSSYQAELNLVGNHDLLSEALRELGKPNNPSAEAYDVTIRCYLLGEVIDKITGDFERDEEEEELEM